ncbi:MAG: aldehyde dehydrogenase family protein [Anaerolineae bacterium]|nr:MAG: aldehyde dehydrogenase family protein [Anaerolineae bacterium]
MFQTISPVDNSVYVERRLATRTEIDKTLSTARQAHREWQALPLANRAALCSRMVDAFVAKKDAIAEEITWQMGRPTRYTPFEVLRFEERARHMISIAEHALSEVQVEPKTGFTRFIRREPLGVVLVLAPWNYPYLTAVNSIVPALMAGNTVILKHSQQTPLCAERMVEASVEAGFPEGVFQFLHATHEDIARMIGDDRVDFVAFTGSVAGGHAVQRAASERFIATGLELGGKDPAYVRADAHLAHAVENVVDGVYFNSGQSCCGVERVYVDSAIYDDFVDGFVELTKQYILDDPTYPETTLGPMVTTRAANFVRGQIAEAIQAGAKALIDERHFPKSQPDTPYLAPQVLVEVDHTMSLMTEESFGPVVGIMRVKDEAEAIRLMNDSQYGLTASIWTTDEEAAIRIGGQVETGTLFMNRCDYLDPALAWTGVKNSGRGCTLSVLGYEQLTRPKSFHLRTAI